MTGYEMRISDCSSDVCSSDLDRLAVVADRRIFDPRHSAPFQPALARGDRPLNQRRKPSSAPIRVGHRSEERRVGEECGSKCRSRWDTSNLKNTNTTILLLTN